jgi:hypothetical protein
MEIDVIQEKQIEIEAGPRGSTETTTARPERGVLNA